MSRPSNFTKNIAERIYARAVGYIRLTDPVPPRDTLSVVANNSIDAALLFEAEWSKRFDSVPNPRPEPTT